MPVASVTLLRDPHNTFWTSTSWASEGAMKAFMHAKPHGPTLRSPVARKTGQLRFKT